MTYEEGMEIIDALRTEVNRLKISERAWREIASNRLDEIRGLVERNDNQSKTIETYQRKLDDIADLVA